MEQKRTISVTLRVPELMYDIMNKTFLTGQARYAEQGGKNYEAASNMQASEDNENSYQLRRSITSAFAQVKSLLGEYLDETNTTTDNIINDQVDKDGTLTLSFLMPSNYNQASADSLGAAIHNYITDRAIYDWFIITDREDAKAYIELAAEALEVAKRALYKRSRPERPDYGHGLPPRPTI